MWEGLCGRQAWWMLNVHGRRNSLSEVKMGSHFSVCSDCFLFPARTQQKITHVDLLLLVPIE